MTTDLNTVPDFINTNCGGRLCLPPHIKAHLEAHPEAIENLEEMASLVTLPRDGSFVLTTVDFGRVVGRDAAVELNEPVDLDTPTTFAIRKGRENASHVVVGVEGPEVTTMVVIAGSVEGKEGEGHYTLFTSYPAVGPAPKERTDPYLNEGEEAASMDYWAGHALAYNPDTMDEVFTSTWRKELEKLAANAEA